MVTHNDETFELFLWDLSIATEVSAEVSNIQNSDVEFNSSTECDETTLIKTFNYPSDVNTLVLRGHEDEVHCVRFLLPLVVSGSADKTIRIWKIQQGLRNENGTQTVCNEINDGTVVCLRILSGKKFQLNLPDMILFMTLNYILKILIP